MAFTIVRSVATKITSSLTGAGASLPPGGTPTVQPVGAVTISTDMSRRIVRQGMQ